MFSWLSPVYPGSSCYFFLSGKNVSQTFLRILLFQGGEGYGGWTDIEAPPRCQLCEKNCWYSWSSMPKNKVYGCGCVLVCKLHTRTHMHILYTHAHTHTQKFSLFPWATIRILNRGPKTAHSKILQWPSSHLPEMILLKEKSQLTEFATPSSKWELFEV